MNDDRFKLNVEAYKTIFNIENMLRSIILNRMNKYNSDWWNELNGKYIDRVKDLKETDEYELSYMLQRIQKKVNDEVSINSHHIILMHDIYYTNLMDLYFIIKRYWVKVFNFVITGKNIDQFRKSFDISNKIRNKVMHSKPLTEWEFKELSSFKSFLEEKIQFNELNGDYFNNYVSLNTVLDDFLDEVSSHNELIISESFDTIKMLNNTLLKYNSEWWWASNIFSKYKVLFDPYYILVEEINSKIIDYQKDLVPLFELEQYITRTEFKKMNSSLTEEIKK